MTVSPKDPVEGTGRSPAARGFRIAMAAGLLLTLAANAPGHLSYDSVVSLTEAREGERQTWAPAISSAILKPFDALVGGTGLYVTASAALLFFCLMSLTRLRPRASWAAVALGVGVILTPQVLIYQGIVWRDVLCANLAVAGFVLLAHAARRWGPRPPILPLAGALLCLALTSLARQNGLILVAAGAGVVAWTARGGGWRASFAWGLGGLVAAVVLAAGVDRLATPPPPEGQVLPGDAGLQILQHYDIVGAVAHHPKLKLTEIGRADPAAEAYLEAHAAQVYSPVRIDTLDSDPALGRALWRTPAKAMGAQWRAIILRHPAAYLLQRADVFRWTLLTPKLELCLPVAVGVSGSPDMLKDLDIQAGARPQDQGLAEYASHFYRTPVYSHLTWVVVALGMIGLLLRRRDPADCAVIGLLVGALAFTASFAIISVACDYRYLYLMDLAGMAGLLYVALDPPRWRGR